VSEIFAGEYAGAYDLIYADKDYRAECDLIERAFELYAPGKLQRILDLGCGTGAHVLELARRGYDVTGVDRSVAMLKIAREKAAREGVATGFSLGDLRTIDLGLEFDAVLMMFAVLGYQLKNADVLAALRTARRHLTTSGLLLFDVWYGPAVLMQRPSRRTRKLPWEHGELVRVSDGVLDVRHQRCTVTFRLEFQANGEVAYLTDETHDMRFFFPLELELFMSCAGLSLVQLAAFPYLDRKPDDSTWNVVAVAQAIEDRPGGATAP
jgi:SAM-dependent methyltransferase